MKKNGKYLAPSKRKKGKIFLVLFLCVVCSLAIAAFVAGGRSMSNKEPEPTTMPTQLQYTETEQETTQPVQQEEIVPTEPEHHWETGFVASWDSDVQVYDEEGVPLGALLRGAQVEYEPQTDGKTLVRTDEMLGFLQENATVVSDFAEVIPDHTLYVRSAVNLRDVEGNPLAALAEKGQPLAVTGFDYLNEDGTVHMFKVAFENEEGYVMPWYLAEEEAEALTDYDDGNYAIHADREDLYGGGGAANLDYYPREKGLIEGNVMPEECRTLYVVAWRLDEIDSYIEIADNSGINAFVVDIVDGYSVGYASDVMKQNCPSAAAAASNTVEAYQSAIQKIKDAGYYVIGRITTFNDTYYVSDHPEYAITDPYGAPLKLSGEYWPTPFNRNVWQYKVALAVEAVELMGFNEIQFDYVRFPDLTWDYEEAGTIDFHNSYGETKAQAIQRFLMYAADTLHEHGAYVSVDVFGECAYNYVTAYGQYWPAISNVVDVISSMPYPDHFHATGTWRPWEHPYDTLYSWGVCAMDRQSETATPAAVRTWIQAYDAIREPYNTYGVEEITAQIKGLRDSGCNGGYLTWNAASSIDKYKSLIPAFADPVAE